MSHFSIDPDIRAASTLQTDFYLKEKYFKKSKERIFERSWQFVGTKREFSEGVNAVNKTLLEGMINEPILLSRDATGTINCLSNVCTHRGNLLVEGHCREDGIRCRYHGRRFSLDGKFLSMPEFEGVKDFPREKDNLRKIQLGEWGNFLFASIEPVASFDEFIGDIRQRLNWFNFESLEFSETLSRDYLINAHWALYCENYLEGFHIPFVHQSLNQAVDYGSYTTETFSYSSLQIGLAKHGEDAFDLPESSADFGKSVAAFYFFLFPNLMFNFYPWGLSLNIVKPINPGLTKVSYLTYISDESKLNTGAGADVNRVELEDQAIVEAVQKGIRSRFYDRGRYSPSREQGTHHFHRLIAGFMND